MDKENNFKEKYNSDKKYAYWLNSIPGIGSRTIRRLKEQYGSAAAIYRLSENTLKQYLTQKQLDSWDSFTLKWDIHKEFDSLGEQEVTFYTSEDNDYPARLRQIPDAPFGIFCKGHLPAESLLSVAVVGARDCSDYGRYLAKQLGSALGSSRIQLISGMARGIDSISQEAAMEAGGESFGVLGCGPDICYPAQNRSVYRRLLVQGGILSPYPPGTRPESRLFPPRNRIVSGLADVLVVIEARQKSGTLITVDMALEQGREVYAVPGRLTDRLSDGCNRLIRQGAGILLSPDDFLNELMLQFPHKLTCNVPPNPGCTLTSNPLENQLTEIQKTILGQLDFYPKSFNQLKEALPDQHTCQELTRTLMELSMKGLAASTGQGYFQKTLP